MWKKSVVFDYFYAETHHDGRQRRNPSLPLWTCEKWSDFIEIDVKWYDCNVFRKSNIAVPVVVVYSLGYFSHAREVLTPSSVYLFAAYFSQPAQLAFHSVTTSLWGARTRWYRTRVPQTHSFADISCIQKWELNAVKIELCAFPEIYGSYLMNECPCVCNNNSTTKRTPSLTLLT